MLHKDPIIIGSFISPTGNQYKIRVFVSDGVVPDNFYLVQKHDPVTDELYESYILQKAVSGKWIERDSGATVVAQELGDFIDAHS